MAVNTINISRELLAIRDKGSEWEKFDPTSSFIVNFKIRNIISLDFKKMVSWLHDNVGFGQHRYDKILERSSYWIWWIEDGKYKFGFYEEQHAILFKMKFC